jgi:hypothetical protein
MASAIDLGQNGGGPSDGYVRRGECDDTRGRIARELGSLNDWARHLSGDVGAVRSMLSDLVVPRVDELGRNVADLEHDAERDELTRARKECADLRARVESREKEDRRTRARRVAVATSLAVGLGGALADLIARALGH